MKIMQNPPAGVPPEQINQDKSALPIAVMDSGVGGLSVLRELVRQMPAENYLYFGDTAHVPYGDKSPEEVRQLTLAHVAKLHCIGIKALVLACNTATAAAVDDLRAWHTDIPILSVEPAIKPAVLNHPGQRVIVMATPTTLRQERFNRLLSAYSSQAKVELLPCPGLASLIEQGITQGPEIDRLLERLIQPVRQPQAAAVVLGCTHYPFAEVSIRRSFGYPLDVYDGSAGTARECKRRLAAEDLLLDSAHEGHITFCNTAGDPDFKRRAWQLLESQ